MGRDFVSLSAFEASDSLVAMMAAIAVVGETLDDAAIGNRPCGTIGDHARKFGFEIGEAGKPPVHFRQSRPRNRVRCSTGLIGPILQGEQRADGLKIEAQFAGMPDESETPEIGIFIQPSVALRTLQGRQEADLLVIANGRHLYAAFPCCLANRHCPLHIFPLLL